MSNRHKVLENLEVIKTSENPQRSSEWFKERWGKFTASSIHKLLGIRGLGETGKTYAIERAI